MSEMMDQLQSTITGRSPLVYIYSPEEERIIRGIRELAAGESTPVRLWSSVMGLEGAAAETTDPVKAILSIISQDLRGMIVLRDLAPFMSDPHVVRALREAYNDGRLKHDRVVFLLCADMNVPEALKKEVHLLEVAPPDESDIAAQIHALVAENPDYVIPEDVIRQVILALKGLTENEISYVLHRACRLKNADKDQLLDEIFAEKKNVVKKSGFLEFSPPRWRVDGIGGLDNLKDWLLKRQHMFTREALDAGVPIPKGLIWASAAAGKTA